MQLTYPEENYSSIGTNLPALPLVGKDQLNGGVPFMGHGGRPSILGLKQLRFPALQLMRRNVVYNPLTTYGYGQPQVASGVSAVTKSAFSKEAPYYGTLPGY